MNKYRSMTHNSRHPFLSSSFLFFPVLREFSFRCRSGTLGEIQTIDLGTFLGGNYGSGHTCVCMARLRVRESGEHYHDVRQQTLKTLVSGTVSEISKENYNRPPYARNMVELHIQRWK